MGFWSQKKEKELDHQTENKMEILFRELNQETDPERKKRIMDRIRETQEEYKETKNKRHKWWFMK